MIAILLPYFPAEHPGNPHARLCSPLRPTKEYPTCVTYVLHPFFSTSFKKDPLHLHPLQTPHSSSSSSSSSRSPPLPTHSVSSPVSSPFEELLEMYTKPMRLPINTYHHRSLRNNHFLQLLHHLFHRPDTFICIRQVRMSSLERPQNLTGESMGSREGFAGELFIRAAKDMSA